MRSDDLLLDLEPRLADGGERLQEFEVLAGLDLNGDEQERSENLNPYVAAGSSTNQGAMQREISRSVASL